MEEVSRAFFATNADGSTTVIGSWFSSANFTLALALFGLGFLLACIATASYYVLVVVTEPSQQISSSGMRSLRETKMREWDMERVLKAIYLAYSTYSTLDLNNLECQTKIFCELQEEDGIVGRTTRRISKFLIFFNVFDEYPFIRSFQEAIKRGQKIHSRNSVKNQHNKVIESNYENHENKTKVIEPSEGVTAHLIDDDNENCSEFYPTCLFSIDRFNTQYSSIF